MKYGGRSDAASHSGTSNIKPRRGMIMLGSSPVTSHKAPSSIRRGDEQRDRSTDGGSDGAGPSTAMALKRYVGAYLTAQFPREAFEEEKEPVDLGSSKFLYRGVDAKRPGIREARKGIVIPASLYSTMTATAHNGRRSYRTPFTSWTRDLGLAKQYAKREGAVVLALPADEPGPEDDWSWEWSPDEYGEEEVLLRGERSGARVISARRGSWGGSDFYQGARTTDDTFPAVIDTSLRTGRRIRSRSFCLETLLMNHGSDWYSMK